MWNRLIPRASHRGAFFRSHIFPALYICSMQNSLSHQKLGVPSKKKKKNDHAGLVF